MAGLGPCLGRESHFLAELREARILLQPFEERIEFDQSPPGMSFYEKRDCKDSFRCEYDAILRALEEHRELVNARVEIEILMDSRPVTH